MTGLNKKRKIYPSKPNTKCEECGTRLARFPSQLAPRKYGSFCNKDCLGRFRTRFLLADRSANFKSGWSTNRKYISVYVPWHPKAKKNGHYDLHRLLAEARLGRYLTKDEIVHHKDENHLNNHWDNLVVTSQSEHAKLHFKSLTRDSKGRINGKPKTL